jgi:hypothetical protein
MADAEVGWFDENGADDEENIIKESRSCRNPATLDTHIH